MKTNDSANRHTWNVEGMEYNDVWNYGKEVWCNLEGRYMHIVADFTHLIGTNFNVNLCSVGIMGTQYIRADPLPETLEIYNNVLTTLSIPNIYSSPQLAIGNILDIKLR